MEQIFASSSENLSKALINRRKMELNKLSNKIAILEHDERKACAISDRHKFAFVQGSKAKRRDWWRSDLNHRHYLEKEFAQVVDKRRRENEIRRQFYKANSEVFGLYFPVEKKSFDADTDSEDGYFLTPLAVSQSLVSFRSEPNLMASLTTSPKVDKEKSFEVRPNEDKEPAKQVSEIHLDRMPSIHLAKSILKPVQNAPAEEPGTERNKETGENPPQAEKKEEEPARRPVIKFPKIVPRSTPRRNGDAWPFNTAEDIDKFHKTYTRFLKNTPCFIETRDSIKQEKARKSFLERQRLIEKSKTEKRDERYFNLLNELKVEKF